MFRMSSLALVAAAVVVSASFAARAEIPPLDERRRLDWADAVVTGTVKNLYARDEDKGNDMVDLIVAIEIAVDKVEKPGKAEPPKLVYARTYKAKKRPKNMVGPGGQYRVPQPGERVRAFLRADEDGGFSLLLPNGVDVLKDGAGGKTP